MEGKYVQVFKESKEYLSRINYAEHLLYALVLEQTKNKDIDGVYMDYLKCISIKHIRVSPTEAQINVRDVFSLGYIDYIEDMEIRTTVSNRVVPFKFLLYDDNGINLKGTIDTSSLSIENFMTNVVKISMEIPSDVLNENLEIKCKIYTLASKINK